MSLKQPDHEYSGYTDVSNDPEKCCLNCIYFKAADDKKGICYEYEVLPKAGCRLFKPKK